MSWSNEDDTHEGWAAAQLADGRLASGWTAGHVIVDGGEQVPDSQVIGWRGACACGDWTGVLWTRVASPDLTDPTCRRIYSEDSFAPSDVEDAIGDEWRRHLAPSNALADVRRDAAAAQEARRALDESVDAARAAGASWAEIGQEAGISRQSAHERWGQR